MSASGGTRRLPLLPLAGRHLGLSLNINQRSPWHSCSNGRTKHGPRNGTARFPPRLERFRKPCGGPLRNHRPLDFFSCMKQLGALGMEDHDLTVSASESPEQPSLSPDQAAEGDFGGPFGYGHPAHKPHPFATYTFSAGAIRPLPIQSQRRRR